MPTVSRIVANWPAVFPLWSNRFAVPAALQRGVLTVAVRGEEIGRQVAACVGLAERATKAAGATVRRIAVVNLDQKADSMRRACPVKRSDLRSALARLPVHAVEDCKHPAASKVHEAAQLLREALWLLDQERQGGAA